MTRDENDLAKINLFRMSMSPIGNLIVSAVTLPLINRMGGDQAAWIKVTLVYAVVAMILLLWCFFGTKERVNFQAASKAESLPLSQRIKALGKNKYFLIMMGRHAHAGYLPNAQRHGCHLLFAVCTRSQRVLQRGHLAENIPQIIVIMILAPFIKRFGKRNLALAGAIIAAAAQVLLMVQPDNFGCVLLQPRCAASARLRSWALYSP